MVIILSSVRILHAQYFGQNKIRYETFDFKILKTQNFDIYYYDRERPASEQAGRMAERWRQRLSQLLNWQLPRNQIVILYDSHSAFEGTTVIPGYISESTGGVTEGLRRRVVMPFAGAMAETHHVLGHELVHAFQYDIAKRSGPRAGTGTPGILALPLWFIEGMAEYLSVGSNDPLTAMWMRDAVSRDDIPSLRHLDNPKYFPYRWGQAFWAFAAGRYGDAVVAKALQSSGGGNAEAAISHATGISAEEISKSWRQALADHYRPVLKVTEPAEQQARALVPASKDTPIHVAPVVSPDGTRMVLFSQKDPFAIDLYLADANTGMLQRRITETAVDPHIDSLEFINSAGDWTADGKRFVYTTVSNGRPQLAIYDLDRNELHASPRSPRWFDKRPPPTGTRDSP
jgi:hypothetical protein